MGSSCSILNDTECDVWITHGVNKTALMATLGGVGVVLSGGVGLAALGAGAGVGGALAGGGALIMAEEGIIMGTTATTLAGLTATQWTLAGIVTGTSASALSTALGVSIKDAEKIQREVKKFQNESELIRPGEKYTWKGSLSLTMTVYVMNEKLQRDSRACWTGATDGSDRLYKISEDFPALDVKK